MLQKFMGKGKKNKTPRYCIYLICEQWCIYYDYKCFVDSDLTIPLTTEPRSELSVNRMEGYLTIKESKNWVREYFVLQGSDVYYYHKKEVCIHVMLQIKLVLQC